MKTSTKTVSIVIAAILAICALACDSDEGDIACSSSGWSAVIGEQPSGDFVVATAPSAGNAWSINFDSLTNKASDRITCGMTSVQPVETGLHDNFTCQRSTGAGEQESWSAAKFQEVDLRPTITITSRTSSALVGTIEGVALNTAIVVGADGTASAREPRYVPFKVAFNATYNPEKTCDSGLKLDPPTLTGCTNKMLKDACNASPSCEASGEQCASATAMIALPATPDVTACVKAIEFIRDSCQ